LLLRLRVERIPQKNTTPSLPSAVEAHVELWTDLTELAG
jgi:hypothetical protein